MVNIACCAEGLLQFIQWELVSDDLLSDFQQRQFPKFNLFFS